jgi:hypothetical protein
MVKDLDIKEPTFWRGENAFYVSGTGDNAIYIGLAPPGGEIKLSAWRDELFKDYDKLFRQWMKLKFGKEAAAREEWKERIKPLPEATLRLWATSPPDRTQRQILRVTLGRPVPRAPRP